MAHGSDAQILAGIRYSLSQYTGHSCESAAALETTGVTEGEVYIECLVFGKGQHVLFKELRAVAGYFGIREQ
jgi:hypothetical protein